MSEGQEQNMNIEAVEDDEQEQEQQQQPGPQKIVDLKLDQEVEIEPGKLWMTLTKEAEDEDATRPAPGSELSVHYTGTKTSDGSEFDCSRKRGEPFKTDLTGVIVGWQRSMNLLKTGERANVRICPEWAYGTDPSQGRGLGGEELLFDVELLSWAPKRDDVSQGRDGSLLKEVTAQGKDTHQNPAYESRVTLDVELFSGDKVGAKFSQGGKSDFSFEIGGDVELPGVFETAVRTLCKGEVANFICYRKPDFSGVAKLITGAAKDLDASDKCFLMKISCKEFTVVQTWGWKGDEKINEAVKRKDAGNGFFKKKEFKKAYQKYSFGLEFVNNDFGLETEEQKKKCVDTRVALRGNMAQICLLESDWRDALEECDRILAEPGCAEHPKTLFRKAKALSHIEEWDTADSILKHLSSKDPSNADIVAEIAENKARKSKYTNKQKSLFGGMFSKIDLSVKEEPAPPIQQPAEEEEEEEQQQEQPAVASAVSAAQPATSESS